MKRMIALIELLSIKPRLARAWIYKARIEARRENYLKSLEYCDHAISTNPTDPRVWNNRAYALYKLGKFKECIKSAEKAVSIRPDYFMAWNHMSQAYGAMGKTRKFKKFKAKFEKSLKKGVILGHTIGHNPVV